MEVLPELEAMKQVHSVLQNLSGEERQNVLEWVYKKFQFKNSPKIDLKQNQNTHSSPAIMAGSSIDLSSYASAGELLGSSSAKKMLNVFFLWLHSYQVKAQWN